MYDLNALNEYYSTLSFFALYGRSLERDSAAPLIHYTLCVCLRAMFMHIPMGDLQCSLDVNFDISNLSFEPEDKIKMGSCL